MDRETQLGLLDRIQAHRAAGRGTNEAVDVHVTYGRNEPLLAHYERSLNALLG